MVYQGLKMFVDISLVCGHFPNYQILYCTLKGLTIISQRAGGTLTAEEVAFIAQWTIKSLKILILKKIFTKK